MNFDEIINFDEKMMQFPIRMMTILLNLQEIV